MYPQVLIYLLRNGIPTLIDQQLARLLERMQPPRMPKDEVIGLPVEVAGVRHIVPTHVVGGPVALPDDIRLLWHHLTEQSDIHAVTVSDRTAVGISVSGRFLKIEVNVGPTDFRGRPLLIGRHFARYPFG